MQAACGTAFYFQKNYTVSSVQKQGITSLSRRLPQKNGSRREAVLSVKIIQ